MVVESEKLNKINSLLRDYKDRLLLSNITSPKRETKNYISYANSEIYSDIVIKFCTSHWEFIREAEALKLFNGNYVCKCYETDFENEVLILQRIVPGDNLHSITDVNQKIGIFAGLLERILTFLETDAKLPNHRDVLTRIIRKSEEDPNKYKEIQYFIDIAEYLYDSIDTSRNPILLHGDLNHRNILSGIDNWTAIDPLGLIGERCFETPRFIRNELFGQKANNRLNHLDMLLEKLSEVLCEEKVTLARAFLIEQICTTCWFVENNSNAKQINEEIHALKLVNSYIKKI